MFTFLALVGAIVFIIVATAKLNMHAWLALLLAALGFGVFAGLDPSETVKAANEGFGKTIGNIGSVVILGGIIGIFLEKSGGALKIAEAVLRKTGEKNIPAAMAGIGYVVSIPVFCDTGFVILSALNRALSKRAGVTLASGAIALALGLYATHTLVPPTPGPVAAAGILGADLGTVILIGMIVAALALVPGWLFAVHVAGKVHIDPDSAGSSDTAVPMVQAAPAPGVGHSLLPILLPLLLIVGGSLASMPSKPLGDGLLAASAAFLGLPTVSLLIGAALSLTLPRTFSLGMLSQQGWVGEAINATALILIVTGAGGAFAGVLSKTDIGQTLGNVVSGAGPQFGILIPFAIAALIKTAQGSSTVAMITTAGIVLPLLPALGLDSELALAMVTVSIGAGAMLVSHANDSYFWVVTQFSGMTPKQGFQLHSIGTLIQGGAAGLLIWVASLVFL